MKLGKEKITLILAIFLTLVVIVMNFVTGRMQQQEQSSLSNVAGSGLSIVMKFFEKKVSVNSEPLLFPAHLSSIDLYIIDSPIFPVSEKEKETLRSFVSQGGHLYLSFLRQENFSAFKNLISEFSLPEKIKKNDIFKNREAIRIKEENETSYVYSSFIFDDAECGDPKLSQCYFRESSVGKGKIFIQAGLPLFSNALLVHEENQNYLLKMGEVYSRIAIDGYHQFFAQKSWADLLSNYRIFLPLFFFIVFIFMYFIFRPYEETEPDNLGIQPKKNYHELYKDVMTSSIRNEKTWTVIVNELNQINAEQVGKPKSKLEYHDLRKTEFFSTIRSSINKYKFYLKQRSGNEP